MAPPQPCRYYKSSIGCRNGASCKFLHVVNISAPEIATVPPLEARSGTGDNTNVPVGTCRYYWTRGSCTRGATCTFLHQTPACPTPVVPPARVPQGVCRAYWTTGQCKRSAECRYAHRANPNTASLETQNIKMIEPDFIDTVPEALPSIESDKYSSGVGSSVTPTEANGHLKPFIQDDFRFQGAAQVYLFLEHICSASTQNPHWKPEDGLNHLGKLVKGNGILRMNDAINYPWTRHVGIKWSFQRGYLPLLTYMSSEWVVKSAANHEVNALYSLIDRNTEAFCDTITQSMTKQMQANTFQEQDSPPLSGVQVFRALFITLLEYTTRFRAAATNPAVRRLIQRSAGWFDEWLRGLGPPPLFQDEITTYEEARYVFLIEGLSRLKADVLNATATAPSSPRPQPPYTNTSRLLNALGISSHSRTVPVPHSPVAPFPKNPGHGDPPNHHVQVNPRPPQRTDHGDLKGTPSPATMRPSHGDRPQAVVSGRTLLSEWLLLCDQGERGESNDNFAGLLAGFTAEKIYRLSDIKDRSEADFLAMEFPTTPGGPTFRMARGTAIRLRQYIAADI